MYPRRPTWLLLVSLLAACAGDDDAPATDFAAWTNPVTGAVVQLPEGWRHSPDTAAKGETVVGYFLPRYSWTLGHFGHVTLHHEDLSAEPMTLEQYTAVLAGYLHERARDITQTVFSRGQDLASARFEVEIVHNRRLEILRCLIWTRGDGHFWYAVSETLDKDRAFFTKALPVVDLLVASTAPPVSADSR